MENFSPQFPQRIIQLSHRDDNVRAMRVASEVPPPVEPVLFRVLCGASGPSWRASVRIDNATNDPVVFKLVSNVAVAAASLLLTSERDPR